MKTAVVVLADGFEEVEAVTPIDLLRRAGVRVIVAGLDGLAVTGSHGITVECEVTLDGVSAWDALVLPGGNPGAQNLARSPLVKQSIERTQASDAWLAAICAAPGVVLGPYGLLTDRTYTGYPGTEKDGWGGTYSENKVVVDGKLLTSRGFGTASAFGLKLVELLTGPEKAAEVAKAVLLG